MHSSVKRFAALVFFAALAAPATAQTVFDNGNPDFVNGLASDPGSSQLAAETFAFDATTTFNTVRWFGAYLVGNTPTFPDVFTISFFDTTAGTPNAAPRIGEVFTIGNPGRADTGQDVLSYDTYLYEATLATPITMGAGAFGISIVNDTTADTDDDWYWLTSADTTGSFTRSTPNDAFTFFGGGLAFQLINRPRVVVPEAGTLALVLPALTIGFVVVRRKRRVK